MAVSKAIIDFTNVKDQGSFNPRRVLAGDYKAKIVKVEDATSKQGNKQWIFTISPVSNPRATYPYYCGTDDPNQAWKIRNLFLGAGVPVPKKRVRVDPTKVVGRLVGIALEDDEYEGRQKSVIAAVFPVSELAGDTPEEEPDINDDEVDDVDDNDEDYEEPKPRPVKKAAKKAAPKKRRRTVEEDDTDEYEDEDLEELDLDDL